jgi:hypothetical protein
LNLRDAHHADHRFRDGCLPGLGQSSYPATVSLQVLVEVPGVEPGPAPHQGAAQTAMLHLDGVAEGARIERAPGRDARTKLGQPSIVDTCPWQELNLHARCGHASLSRVRLPVPPQGPVLPVEGSNLGLRVQSAVSLPTGPTGIGGLLPAQGSNLAPRSQSPPCCRLHQPGSSVVCECPYQDSNLDWTRSERAASSVGLQGHPPVAGGGACPGSRTRFLPLTRRVLCHVSLTGMAGVRLRGVDPDWPDLQ